MEQESNWVLLNKQSQHKIKVIKSRMNVGRCATADIICYSDKISRNHGYITVDADGDLYVHDNQSINGTFINRQKIESNKLHKLRMQDEVGFGLHSEAVIDEGRKYIFEVVDLRTNMVGTENKTEAKTTKTNEILQPVVLLTDIKLEPPDISNIHASTSKSHQGYTIEDSVIIVNSDESDDELGPCSQLLNEIKTDSSQIDPRIGDSIFFEVKQELQNMEEGAEHCVVYIDDEFADDAVSNHELVAMLEDSFVNNNCNEITVPPKETIKDSEKKSTNKVETSSTSKKYVIPPIISPHIEVPKSRKRKGSMEVLPSKNKRSKSIDVAVKPNKKENTELKNKLKAVALKEKAVVVLEKQKVAPAPAKVKVSTSRGNFLMKPVDIKPNMTRKSSPEKPASVLPHRASSRFLNVPSTSAASLSENGYKHGSIAISLGNFKLSETHRVLEDILIQFLSWNPKWLNERKLNDALPPINKKPLVKLPNSFKNYTEYYNIVLPHWIVELWYFFCKEFDSHANRPREFFKVEIEKCTNNGKFIELKCFVFISKKDCDLNLHVKEDDVLFLDVTFEKTEKLRGAYFGCVNNVKKTLTRSNTIRHNLTLIDGKVPHAVVDFNILMKTSRDIKSFKRTLQVNVFTNMVSTWRIFMSIKHLKHSPLCDHILKPNLQTYQQLLNNINPNTLKLDAKLNTSQKYAVAEATKLCLGKEAGIFLIQGPPGTGKSTVIVNIVKQILLTEKEAKEQCILLVAPTNTAIDELLVKLINLRSKVTAEDRNKLKIVRFGPENCIGPNAKDFSLSVLAKSNLFQSCSQKFCQNTTVIEMQSKINSLKSQVNQNPQIKMELVTRKELLEKKYKELMGRSYMLELNAVEQTLLAGAKIICTTLSSCIGTRMMEVFSTLSKISCCIVDEATFSKEQETLIPLKLGISKLVLVGDPKQLPGIIFAQEAKEFGHGNSLFARLMANFEGAPKSPIRMLNVQYRMHPEICKFPNHTYYKGLLNTDTSVLKRKNPTGIFLRPYLVFQMENDLININKQQEYQNDSEIRFILTLIRAIVGILPNSHSINIGVITPYNVQKDNIRQMLQNNKFRPNVFISVHTVDSFQGKEKDIIIVSSVRLFSNNFLADNQRLNVSLTRAKYALFVIGTENLFKTCEIFGKLHRDSKKRNLLIHIPSTIDVPYLTTYIKQNKLYK